MKNVFVILTERTSAGTPGNRVAINMSRVQEMWPTEGGSTKMLMNIPGAWVVVMESVETILARLDDVNRDGSGFVADVMAKARKELPDGK